MPPACLSGSPTDRCIVDLKGILNQRLVARPPCLLCAVSRWAPGLSGVCVCVYACEYRAAVSFSLLITTNRFRHLFEFFSPWLCTFHQGTKVTMSPPSEKVPACYDHRLSLAQSNPISQLPVPLPWGRSQRWVSCPLRLPDHGLDASGGRSCRCLATPVQFSPLYLCMFHIVDILGNTPVLILHAYQGWTQGSATFFCQGPGANILGFEDHATHQLCCCAKRATSDM